MLFIYKTAKFAPVRTTIPKLRAIFVHRALTEHALHSCSDFSLNLSNVSFHFKIVQSEQLFRLLRLKSFQKATGCSNHYIRCHGSAKGCGGAGCPPPIIFERLKLPQQVIYRRKGNLSESRNHFKYRENILISRFYEQFSRSSRNFRRF